MLPRRFLAQATNSTAELLQTTVVGVQHSFSLAPRGLLIGFGTLETAISDQMADGGPDVTGRLLT